MKLNKANLLLYILITPDLFGQHSTLRRQIENTVKYDFFEEGKVAPGFIVGIIDDYKTCVEALAPAPGTKIELKNTIILKLKIFLKQ